MIRVPDPILSSLSASYHVQPADLIYLGGGRIDSDGIAYTYTREQGGAS